MDYFGWIQLVLFVGVLLVLTKPMGMYLVQVMNVEGKTSQEISEELAKRNIFVTWQRVRGRIAFMTRKPKEALQTPKDEGKTPEIQSSQSKPESAKTSQPVEPAVESDIPPRFSRGSESSKKRTILLQPSQQISGLRQVW